MLLPNKLFLDYGPIEIKVLQDPRPFRSLPLCILLKHVYCTNRDLEPGNFHYQKYGFIKLTFPKENSLMILAFGKQKTNKQGIRLFATERIPGNGLNHS